MGLIDYVRSVRRSTCKKCSSHRIQRDWNPRNFSSFTTSGLLRDIVYFVTYYFSLCERTQILEEYVTSGKNQDGFVESKLGNGDA